MTLIESRGPGSAPPRELLDAAPVGSRIVIHYAANVRTIYRKQPNGMWRGTNWVPGRRPTMFAAELSSLVFSVFDQEAWQLHHPGIVRVLIGYAGRRYWKCYLCSDTKGEFDSIGAARVDASAHVANHAEIARVS